MLFLFLWLIFFFSFHLFFFLALKASYADWITANALSSSATLAALCSAAALRRTHFSEARCSVVAADAASMVALLRGESGGATTRAVDAAAPQRRTALLFTGQGDVYTGMGAALFASQPVFRRELETVAALLREELAIPLLDVMFDAVHSAALKEARYTQPALFAVEWATAQMWEAWGLGAVAVAGHSLGEFAAAAVAGLLPLADVAAMVALRGRLIDALPARGGMLSVFASAEAVAEHVAGTSVSVAGINNPGLTTVAGEVAELNALAAALAAAGVQSKRVDVAHAFHSKMMEPVTAQWKAGLAALPCFRRAGGVRAHTGASDRARFASTVDAAWADGARVATVAYWAEHMLKPVRFMDAIRLMSEEGVGAYVEVGPHSTLCSLGRRCVPVSASSGGSALWCPSMVRGNSEDALRVTHQYVKLPQPPLQV